MRALACVILLAGLAAAAPPAWTEFPLRSESQVRAETAGGGGGARVQAIAWSAADPTRVVVGTDRNGVWLSDDGGAVLRPARGLPLPDIKALRFSPWRPKVVYCLASARDEASFSASRIEGLWQSADGGATWSLLVAMPLEEGCFGGLLAFTEDKGARTIIAGSHGRGLLVSRDAGDSWEWVRIGKESWVAGIVGVGPVVIAATSEGVFRAPDLRLSFEAVPALTDARFIIAAGDVLSVGAGDPPAIFLAWPEGGMYASQDLGATWKPLGKRALRPERYFASVTASRRREGLLLGMVRAVGRTPVKLPLVSTDGGALWAEPEEIRALGRFTGPRAYSPEAIAFHPQSAGVALAGIDRELMRTTDGGFSWLPWGAGLFGWETGGAHFIAREPLGVQRLWLALGEAGLWRSDNGGRSFAQAVRTQDRCVGVACFAEGDKGVVFAWWEREGLLSLRMSADGGGSWRAVAENVACRPSFAFHPVKHGTFHAGCLSSTDGGASFVRGQVDVLALAPRTGEVKYGVDTRTPWQLLRAREDAWENVPLKLFGAPRCAAVNPDNADDLFVGTTEGLFRYKEGACRRCDPAGGAPRAELHVTAVLFDAHRPGRIIAAARDPWQRAGGVLESLNGGENWEYHACEHPVSGLVQLGRDELVAATDAGFFLVGQTTR